MLTIQSRCNRLNKECEAAPTVRKKRVTRKLNLSNTAALEQKLESIVNMLQQTQATQAAPSAMLRQAQDSSSNNIFQPHLNPSPPSNAPPTPVASTTSAATPEFPDTFPDVDPCIVSTPQESIQVTPELKNYPKETNAELQSMLNEYRTDWIRFFPVAIIPPETTVQQMQDKRPFLWLVIRACCSKSHARQDALGQQVRMQTAQTLLMDCTRNLDLLFGLMVYAAWCHSYISKRRIITTLLHLAMSVAGDLGLTRPVPVELQGVMKEFNAQGCPKSATRISVVRTVEERRASIGLFYLTSL
jgi:hypothetical protein